MMGGRRKEDIKDFGFEIVIFKVAEVAKLFEVHYY